MAMAPSFVLQAWPSLEEGICWRAPERRGFGARTLERLQEWVHGQRPAPPGDTSLDGRDALRSPPGRVGSSPVAFHEVSGPAQRMLYCVPPSNGAVGGGYRKDQATPRAAMKGPGRKGPPERRKRRRFPSLEVGFMGGDA